MLERIRSFTANFSFKKRDAAIKRLPISPSIRPNGYFIPLLRTEILAVLFCSAIALALTGCDDLQGTTEATAPTRPVTIIRLREQDFTRETNLTGSVGLYREQKIGFEVGGRLLWVRDLGREVTGPAQDKSGRQVQQGDVIARLDDTRYRLRVKALEARIRSLQKEREAQQIDVDKVAHANLESARATLRVAETNVRAAGKRIDEIRVEKDRAAKELARQRQLMTSAVGRKKNLEDAEAAFDSAKARIEQFMAEQQARTQALQAQRAAVSVAEATIPLKRAQLESTNGKIVELEEMLNEARENLKDTVLRAVFSGRITAIHAVQGAVLSAGSPVATLSLLDPIQVHIEVSADDDRRIRTGDKAWLFPKDPIDPDGKRLTVNALVFEKDAVANPKTRTFRINLMARNERRKVEHLAPETKGLPLVEDFLPVARRYQGETGPLFVPIDSIYVEEGQTYVLRLPGVGFHGRSNRGAVGKHLCEKVKVSLGSEHMSVIKWRFRSIVDKGTLREGDFLVVHPKKEHLDGLAIGRPQWLLRPGELVPVRFVLDATPRGYYVPINAITQVAGKPAIFSISDGKAKLIPVSVHETHGEHRRIESEALKAELPVITGGLHYVSEGQPVNVFVEESTER